MYEPWGEKKKFRVDFEKIKEWIRGKVKNIRVDNRVAIAIGLVLLLLGFAYTGLMTYTSRINEARSKLLILERQINALEEELNSTRNSLASCSSELESTKKKLSDSERDLRITGSKLSTCELEKEKLDEELKGKEKNLNKLQGEYETLNLRFKSLEARFEKLQCEYGKRVCKPAGLNYYYLRDDMTIGCCWSTSVDSCSPPGPDSEDMIKEIVC